MDTCPDCDGPASATRSNGTELKCTNAQCDRGFFDPAYHQMLAALTQ